MINDPRKPGALRWFIALFCMASSTVLYGCASAGWENMSEREIAQWKSNDFDAARARQWKQAGFTPQEATNWTEAKFDIYSATYWKDEQFNAEEAQRWRAEGFDVDDAVEMRAKGLTPVKPLNEK